MRRALALLVPAMLCAGCPAKVGPAEDPNVVATVNGEVLRRADFERELSRELQALQQESPVTPEQLEPFKRALVTTLVDRTLLLQAAKAAEIQVAPADVDRQVLKLAADYPPDKFEELLAQGHTSQAELRRRTSEQLTIEKLLERQVYARVAVTEEEIRQHYEEHSADFQRPEAVHAAQIVVAGLDEAKKVQSQLYAGKKFGDLARRYSVAPEARVGGDLGFFERGVMPPQIEEVVFRLGVNQSSDIVSTDFGYHLVRVLERRPAQKRELVEVRALIEEKLLGAKRAAAQEDYVRSLKERAQVKVNETTVQRVTSSGRGSHSETE